MTKKKTFKLIIELKSGKTAKGEVTLGDLKPFSKMLRSYGHKIITARRIK